MKSTKKLKPLEDIMGKKTFFFPDSLSNDRMMDTHERCISLLVNGNKTYIFTGKSVEITLQEFSILKDAGIITPNYTYSLNLEFDPILRPYEI
jgi:hypothetical protein